MLVSSSDNENCVCVKDDFSAPCQICLRASQGSTPVRSRALYLWLAAGLGLERYSCSHLYNLNSSFNYYLASSAVNEWTETGGNLSCLRQKKKWTNVARGEQRVTEEVLLS